MHAGHVGHGDHVGQFRRLFWIMLVIAVPTIVFSPMFADILGYRLPDNAVVPWISPVLGTVMYVWGGRPFLTGAWSELKARTPGMMLLIGLAITVAYLASLGASLRILDHHLDFWWELALLIVIMLLGHWIEMRSIAQASSALDALAALLPDEAERVLPTKPAEPVEANQVPTKLAEPVEANPVEANQSLPTKPAEPVEANPVEAGPVQAGPVDANHSWTTAPSTGSGNQARTELVSPADLRVGDLVVVRPGGRVPADGDVVDGTAAVDESMITGESRPVTRGPGDRVVAGTVATDTALRVRVAAVGDDTALAGIQRLVAQAQSSTSRAQRLADRAAGWLFWFALGAAVLTAIAWTLLGSPDDAVVRTITVLVIACPHALGLAIPLVVQIATERAAKGGVLVTDRLALETMRTVGAVLFDKTGTLTKGEPAVTDAASAPEFDLDGVIAVAAAVERDSEHPLARAIVAYAEARGIDIPAAESFEAAPGLGVSAIIAGVPVFVGGPSMLAGRGTDPLPVSEPWSAAGATVLHVIVGDVVAGAIALADEIRPESREAVDALHALGVLVVMITGDAEPVARSVAAELGIDRVFAGVRPEDKSAKVQELQSEGLTVAMVGDGVNDAPALAQADVGIAIGAGTDVAIASAGVVLASSDPRSVLSVIELSHATYRKMTQNLWWAAGYNLLSVPLAAGVLAPIGFVMPMSVGAILMSLSTVVVALNAQLLRRLDLRPEASVRALR
ncbi:copper-translocating P-type ATPase [Agromyces larvae]|uniref:Copper-translocating P-type ATPase n=1 Tax=Agromyces larvae TaxID=2929802 RepID=A0ABY4BVQ7_9MICO|nr:copper-translocating P-type ATPase [Agromyces larvae]UOE42984.1 copper-translocating P-type ATPase [Agromyces larvae]